MKRFEGYRGTIDGCGWEWLLSAEDECNWDFGLANVTNADEDDGAACLPALVCDLIVNAWVVGRLSDGVHPPRTSTALMMRDDHNKSRARRRHLQTGTCAGGRAQWPSSDSCCMLFDFTMKLVLESNSSNYVYSVVIHTDGGAAAVVVSVCRHMSLQHVLCFVFLFLLVTT